jgi:hypothetical protein
MPSSTFKSPALRTITPVTLSPSSFSLSVPTPLGVVHCQVRFAIWSVGDKLLFAAAAHEDRGVPILLMRTADVMSHNQALFPLNRAV